MSNQTPLMPLLLQYKHFIDSRDPERMTPSDVLEMVDAVKKSLASIEGRTTRAELVSTQVYVRNAAKTLLRRAPWLAGPAAQALRELITGLPEFMLDEKYKFRYDFFQANIPKWEQDLGRFAGRPDLSFLEVGSMEGKSACWLLENILTHEGSRLTCIDIFDHDEDLTFFDVPGADDMTVEEIFDYNIRQTGAAHRVTKLHEPSYTALRALPLEHYDFIYVDGSHVARDVLEDGVLTWRLLKRGGLITFDDYELQAHADPLLCPKLAIDALLEVFRGHYKPVRQEYQLTLEKIS
jgi:hypothetical protein